eukprot:29477-Pelagococcus_subviridis.AAC.6
MSGAVVTAGLYPKCVAARGSTPPNMFAHKLTSGRDIATTRPTIGSNPSQHNASRTRSRGRKEGKAKQSIERTKTPRNAPITNPAALSLYTTTHASLVLICFSAIARITVATLCDPVFPPCPMSSGTKYDSSTFA